MISLYTAFKIIFGLVVAMAIFIIIFTFLGNYIDIQGESQKAQIVSSFLKSSGDVLTTGNSLTFTDFSQEEMTMSFDINEPPGILSELGKTTVEFPLFYSPGDELFISRNHLNLGWWRFYFVEALPRMQVLFSVSDNSEESWDVVREIVETLPSTGFFEPKTTFGLCDDDSIDECGGNNCEREDFLFNIIDPPILSYCSIPKMPQGSILVTVASSCTTINRGVCFETPDSKGIGNLYIRGELIGLYKDPLDIVAAIIGGERPDIYGNSGKTLFRYKNNVYREELLLASKLMASRAQIILGDYPEASVCRQLYYSFSNTMSSLSSLLEDEDYYKDYSTVSSLVELLNQAESSHQNLVTGGCDY